MSVGALLQVASRLLNTPLLVTPAKAEIVVSVLANRIGLSGLTPDASRFAGEAFDAPQNKALPYRLTADGVAVVSIVGTLVNRGAWVGASSGLTSYEGISHQISSALGNPKVKAIVLDIASPGGEAIGAFEVADLVRKTSRSKRVVAVVNGMACSAAYAIASGASEIVTTESGISGSIGVVLLHADYSKALEEKGIKPTLIFAGAHKVDGNPYEPLPESVRADLQKEVDAVYDRFVKTVAVGRGSKLTEGKTRATEARVFTGAEAVAAGLADKVGTFDDALKAATRAGPALTPPNPNRETGTKMSQSSEVASLDRARAILELPEANGRTKVAHRLAFNTTVSVNEAREVLLTVPKGAEADSQESYESRIAATGVNNVGAAVSFFQSGLKPVQAIDTAAVYARRRQQSKSSRSLVEVGDD